PYVPLYYYSSVKCLNCCLYYNPVIPLFFDVGAPYVAESFSICRPLFGLNHQHSDTYNVYLIHQSTVVLYWIHNCNVLFHIHLLSPFCTSYNPNDLSALYFSFLGVLLANVLSLRIPYLMLS